MQIKQLINYSTERICEIEDRAEEITQNLKEGKNLENMKKGMS